MFYGALFYLSLLIGSFITWMLVPKYIMFLLFSMVLLILIINILCSIVSTKKTTITYTLDKEVITRGNDVVIHLIRNGGHYFQCGKIKIYYRIATDDLSTQEGQIVNATMEQDVLLPIVHCGIYEYQVFKEYYYDLLHINFRKKIQNIGKSIIVFPIDKQKTSLLEKGKLVDDTTNIQYTKGNDGSEIFELREYQEGDLLKHIHWKVSMKKQELLVKVGSQTIGDAILITYVIYSDASDNDQMLDTLHTTCTKLNEEHIIYDIGIYDQVSHSLQRVTITDYTAYTLAMYKILAQLRTPYTKEQLQNTCIEKGFYIILKDSIIITNNDGGQSYEETVLS